MSVFGPRDKDVPLLTQLYQLDIAAPDDSHTYYKAAYYHSDLDKWLGRFWGREYWSDSTEYLSPFMEPHSQVSDPEASVLSEEERNHLSTQNTMSEQSRRSSASSDIRSGFYHLINIVNLVKRIMTSVCDKGEISVPDAEFLFEQSKLYRPVPNYRWEVNEQGQIPLGSLEVSDFSPSVNGMEWQVLQALERALNKAQTTSGYLRRCEQCHNVYLRERDQSIYCSRRCNSRAQTRRWRTRGNTVGAIQRALSKTA